jgi:hypothetical protein
VGEAAFDVQVEAKRILSTEKLEIRLMEKRGSRTHIDLQPPKLTTARDNRR